MQAEVVTLNKRVGEVTKQQRQQAAAAIAPAADSAQAQLDHMVNGFERGTPRSQLGQLFERHVRLHSRQVLSHAPYLLAPCKYNLYGSLPQQRGVLTALRSTTIRFRCRSQHLFCTGPRRDLVPEGQASPVEEAGGARADLRFRGRPHRDLRGGQLSQRLDCLGSVSFDQNLTDITLHGRWYSPTICSKEGGTRRRGHRVHRARRRRQRGMRHKDGMTRPHPGGRSQGVDRWHHEYPESRRTPRLRARRLGWAGEGSRHLVLAGGCSRTERTTRFRCHTASAGEGKR